MRDGLDNLTSISRVRRSSEEARAAYDRMSAWYDRLAGPSEQAHVRVGLQTLDAREGEELLEIGFGTGDALVSLAQSVGARGHVYGVDISTGMARKAEEKLERAGVRERASLICADGARLPLADHIVDGVFMSFTLELFDTPRMPLVLDECRRVLREGGRLTVVSLSKRDGGNLAVQLYEWVHQRMPRYVDCRPIPVEEVLADAGFQIEAMDRRSMWGLPVEVVLARWAT